MDVDENNNNIRERADAVGDAAVRAPAQAPEFRPIAERAHRAPGAFDVYHLNEADASLLVPGDDHAVDRLVADRTELPRVRAVADYLENEEEFEMDDWMEDEENEQAFNLDVPREPRVEADARERFRARLADARHEGFLHAIFDAERLRQGYDATASAARVVAAEAAAAAAHAATAAAAARERIAALRAERTKVRFVLFFSNYCLKILKKRVKYNISAPKRTIAFHASARSVTCRHYNARFSHVVRKFWCNFGNSRRPPQLTNHIFPTQNCAIYRSRRLPGVCGTDQAGC